MNAGESFFVGEDGSVSTSPTVQMPALGHSRYSCHECQAAWTFGQTNCPKCRGVVFDETFIEGTLIQRIGDKILGVAPPAKPVVRPLAADDVVVLERCSAAARAFVAALADADRTARDVVNSDRASASTTFLQGRVAVAASTLGDFSAANLTSLAVPVLGFAGLIDAMVAQHAEEVT